MRIASLLLLALMIVVPASSIFSEPQERDVPREVNDARHLLHDARARLEHAGNEWGGHRVAAMNHIDAALHELDEAERWAHEHH
jgi:hypothetical protein